MHNSCTHARIGFGKVFLINSGYSMWFQWLVSELCFWNSGKKFPVLQKHRNQAGFGSEGFLFDTVITFITIDVGGHADPIGVTVLLSSVQILVLGWTHPLSTRGSVQSWRHAVVHAGALGLSGTHCLSGSLSCSSLHCDSFVSLMMSLCCVFLALELFLLCHSDFVSPPCSPVSLFFFFLNQIIVCRGETPHIALCYQ